MSRTAINARLGSPFDDLAPVEEHLIERDGMNVTITRQDGEEATYDLQELRSALAQAPPHRGRGGCSCDTRMAA